MALKPAKGTLISGTFPGAGLGFIHPKPLPVFPAGLTKLHRVFIDEAKTNTNRITRVSNGGNLIFNGVRFENDGVFSDNAAQDWRDLDGSEYIGGAWTYAVMVDLSAVNMPNQIAISGDYSGSGRRGFRITAAVSGARDVLLQMRAHSVSGLANAVIGVDLPSTKYALIIARFDGTTAKLDFPSWTALPRQTGTVSGDPGAAPLSTSSVNFPQKDTPDDPTTVASGIGYAAYAAWGRYLSDTETDTAIASLYAWGRGLGIDV
jgi:hypothetical protein